MAQPAAFEPARRRTHVHPHQLAQPRPARAFWVECARGWSFAAIASSSAIHFFRGLTLKILILRKKMAFGYTRNDPSLDFRTPLPPNRDIMALFCRMSETTVISDTNGPELERGTSMAGFRELGHEPPATRLCASRSPQGGQT